MIPKTDRLTGTGAITVYFCRMMSKKKFAFTFSGLPCIMCTQSTLLDQSV